jgi:Ca2+-binding EF-hand superfamily protein
LFNLFDQDGGGLLDLGELSNIMKHLGRKPAEDELAELIHVDLEQVEHVY